MAAPGTTPVDDFNRADGGLGGNWSAPIWQGDDTPVIISNAVRCGASTGSGGDAYWNAATYTETELWVEPSVVPGTGNGVYINARIQSPNSAGMDCYQLYCPKAGGTDSWELYRVVNQGTTLLATRTQEYSAGDRIALVVLGTGATVTLQIWYQASGGSMTQLGADIADTDANRITAAGYAGFGAEGTTARITAFRAAEQSAAGVVGPLLQGRLVGGGILQGRLIR